MKHLPLMIMLMVLLISVNPHGTDYFHYLIRAISLNRADLIIEWRPLWQIPGQWLLLPLYILSVLIVIYSLTRKKISELNGILFVCSTAWLALLHYRYLLIYALIWSCYIPAYLKETNLGKKILTFVRNRKEKVFLFWAALGMVGIIFAAYNQFWRLQIPTANTMIVVYPAGAVSFLKEQQFSGNVMVPFGVGGFVSWKMYPRVKVSMDSRFEVAYPYDSVKENFEFYQAKPGWRETLTRYDTDALLIPRSSPLDTLMEQSNMDNQSGASPRWRRVYVDDGYSLFIKSGLAEAFPFTDKTGQPIPATFP